MSGFIGPPLPPGLKTDSEIDEGQGELIGPALLISKPKEVDGDETLGIGPLPPPNLNADCKSPASNDLEEDLNPNKDMYGPALPPELTLVGGAHSYGPTLPPGFNPETFQSEEDGMTVEICGCMSQSDLYTFLFYCQRKRMKLVPCHWWAKMNQSRCSTHVL